mgnify:FL=1
MKITKARLKQIIKEELGAVIQEMDADPMMRVAEKMGVSVEELEAILSAEGLSIVSDAAASMSDDERDDYLSAHGAHKSRHTSTGPVIDGTGHRPEGSLAQKE